MSRFMSSSSCGTATDVAEGDVEAAPLNMEDPNTLKRETPPVTGDASFGDADSLEVMVSVED
jgi:hypothetical protein